MQQKKFSASDIECYIPGYSFEFLNGLPCEQINLLATLFQQKYQQKIHPDLDLVEIPAYFAYHLVATPFIGFIWFKKVRKAQYKVGVPASKRNFIMPVGKTLCIQSEAPDIDQTFMNLMLQIAPAKWISTSSFSKKLLNLYYNLYTLSYYKQMAPQETNPLKQKVWEFRASYNNKYVWRWECGARFWAIKPKGGLKILAEL